MYIAEIKGKLSSRLERREDILTSNIFSFFKYSNKKKYLRNLIEKLDLKVNDKELNETEFFFWPRYDDKTEPDVAIVIGDYYLLFEAKYFSDFSITQIKREIEGGKLEAKSLGKEFFYIAITRDYYYKPEKFKEVEKYLDFEHFKWINWQLFCSILENNIDDEKEPFYSMALDLYSLMLKKNLRQFKGYNEIYTPNIFSIEHNIFFDAVSSKYRGKFVGYLDTFEKFDDVIKKCSENIFYKHKYFENLETKAKVELPKNVFFGGSK